MALESHSFRDASSARPLADNTVIVYYGVIESDFRLSEWRGQRQAPNARQDAVLALSEKSNLAHGNVALRLTQKSARPGPVVGLRLNDMTRDGSDFRIRRWSVSFARFSLKEVSKITGVSPTHLRVWKQRGHLPFGNDGIVFTARDVAEIFVRHRLSMLGIPPSETERVGCLGAQHLLWHAIVNHDGVCEASGTHDDVSAWESAMMNSTSTTAAEITGLLDGVYRIAPRRYLWRADDTPFGFLADLDKVISNGKYERHVIVDLQHLAERFHRIASRPLFLFKVSSELRPQFVKSVV